MLKKSIVALFTRAWIEIFGCTRADTGKTVALFTRAWIEISIFCSMREVTIGRPLYEGVD